MCNSGYKETVTVRTLCLYDKREKWCGTSISPMPVHTFSDRKNYAVKNSFADLSSSTAFSLSAAVAFSKSLSTS